VRLEARVHLESHLLVRSSAIEVVNSNCWQNLFSFRHLHSFRSFMRYYCQVARVRTRLNPSPTLLLSDTELVGAVSELNVLGGES
jgi:hypothetical protein